nr:acetyl-CoA carboxylase, biotin carboxyl carrier protein [Calliblepharis sp.]
MKFQIKDLKKILYSIQQSNIDEVYISSYKFKLTINKSFNTINNTKSIINTKNITNSQNIKQKNKEIKKEDQNQVHEPETYFTIVSPMVGTFYCSPAPNEAPFVQLYDIVKKQQIVCIIEAMKLMNEIESEIHGEIVEILVKDGDIIDCGQALMRVKTLNA